MLPWWKTPENPAVPLSEVIFGDQTPKTDIDASPESAALYVSAAMSAIRFLSEALASLPIIIYDENRKRAESNPAYWILHDAPNAFQTPFTFWREAWRRAFTKGNAYIYVDYDRAGRPVRLLLLDSNAVTVRIVNGVKVYTYRGFTLGADEVIHLMGFSIDGLIGVPLLQYAEKPLRLALVAEDYALKFFSDGETVPGYITVPASTDSIVKQIKSLVAEWRQHRHKYPVLPGGAELKAAPTGNNQASQFLELRSFQTLEVSRITRVPPHILMHYATGGTYANVESQGIDLVTNCLQSWITQGEQEITRCFFHPAGKLYAEYLVDARLRGDNLSRMQSYEIAIRSHMMTPNECRARENLQPLSGGDTFPNLPGAAPASSPAPAPAPTQTTQSTGAVKP